MHFYVFTGGHAGPDWKKKHTTLFQQYKVPEFPIISYIPTWQCP